MVKSDLVKKVLFAGTTLAAVSGIFGCGDPVEPNKPRDPIPSSDSIPQSISQTVGLSDFENINYNATSTNVPEATRRTFHNENLNNTQVIQLPYMETLTDRLKGNWTFILEAPDVKPDTTELDIPDYESEAPDLSYLNLNINEGDSTILYLRRPTDKNSADNPVHYTSVISPDGRVIPTIGAFPLDTVLKIVTNGIPGPYQIELGREGSLEKIVLPGEIFNLAHISGQLQNNETDSGELGKIRIYNASDTTFLKETLTDAQGNFDFQLDQPLDSILLQARLETGIPDSNYVRTITLPTEIDMTGLIVRGIPSHGQYDLVTNNISREDFIAHLKELNPNYFKWNLDSLRGVEILDVDPLGRGSFTLEDQDLIERFFLENLSCYTGGALQSLYIQKDDSSVPDSQRHYINEERNWIYFFPDTIMVHAGLAGVLDDGVGNINLAVIRLKNVSELVISHEEGHAFIAPHGHAITLPGTVTIMRNSSLKRPGPADCKAAYVVNETTYTPIESYDNILGLDFFP